MVRRFEPLRRIASDNTNKLEDNHGWVEETNVVNEGAADQPQIEELSDSSSDADDWWSSEEDSIS
jgi:hypothetical protein